MQRILKYLGSTLILLGLVFLVLSITKQSIFLSPLLQTLLAFTLPALGAFIIFWSRYSGHPAGIDNNHILSKAMSSRGLVAWLFSLFLTSFYIIIYFGHKFKIPGSQANFYDFFTLHVYSILDPLAYFLAGTPSNNWFFYSTLYSFAVLVFGVRMIFKYRHNRYQIIRTISVTFVQLGLAYILPNILKLFQQPEFYFSYFWPLKADYFYPSTWASQYGFGIYFLIFGLLMSFIATPILTYFYGKRWYCSWVCGCGALAETMGDPFRQLSDKSLTSWKIERWLVHGILVLIVLITLSLWLNSLGAGWIFETYSGKLSEWYGFYIGAIFSGVIGVGFYPLLGSRVWCRFACPMAAVLGLIQKFFSRFRITTNGAQCISCGNCSSYCEMGIDVRWYAQRGQDIVRASCVGCGICAAVCPRGVLKLENNTPNSRQLEANPALLP